MKKHMLFVSNLIIILTIVTSFIWMVYNDTKTYQELAETHLENILSLADTDITKHIENTMTKPVTVSKTMANDKFLKDWLLQEPNNYKDDTYLNKLYSYLKTYQTEYDYTTVFCISSQTGNYYYQDGLNKILSTEDEHDVWYYNFIKSGHEYDLQVDTNETGGNKITVFINFRMSSDDGKLLGVIGVGLLVDSIENMINAYERDYDLSVYIINVGGSENSFTGKTSIFIDMDELSDRTGINENININMSREPEMQWFTSGGERKCLITKYDDTLGWYLILEKDTNAINIAFQKRIVSSVFYMILSLAICITVTTTVFNIYNKRIIIMANTDDLTGLPNRQLFNKLYPAFVRKHKEQSKSVFIIDIDKFKDINDAYGHMFGNAVLSMVGENLRCAIKGYGIASRWGGDEFLGILTVDTEETKRILSKFMDSLNNEETGKRYHVSVSIGITEFNGKLGLEQLVKKADGALYKAKEDGRNRISVNKT